MKRVLTVWIVSFILLLFWAQTSAGICQRCEVLG